MILAPTSAHDTPASDTGEQQPRRSRDGHRSRERTDIASGVLMSPGRMIRIGYAPDGDIVPDIFGKLPGRGAWVAANRQAVEKAIKTGAFLRAAKGRNKPSSAALDGFGDKIEQGLRARVIGLLTMANRAGELVSGFDKMRTSALNAELAFRVEAQDGAPDGRSKIRVIAKAVAKELGQTPAPVIGLFDAQVLGKIIGRDDAVHMGVRTGRLAGALSEELSRLSGFCSLIPAGWPDREHEHVFIPFDEDGN